MIAVIGDVHGCFFTLENLTELIRSEYDDIELFCVGDLVDRGNFSYEVMEFVAENDIVFTPGNHDIMFYYYMKEPSDPLGKPWIHNGYEPTLRSYQSRLDKMSDHLEMIRSAPLLINHTDCFISHAGISHHYKSQLPENILSDTQTLEKVMRGDLANIHSIVWNRDDLIDLGKLQIVGHTRLIEFKHNEYNNTLYIDTAAVGGNKLSAVIVENDKLINILSVKTNQMDIIKTSF